MRKKIIVGLLFCMLLIPTIITTAEKIDETESTALLTDDVPVWNEGDSWTFTVNDFWTGFSGEGKEFSMNGQINNFRLTVSDTGGSSYTVDVTGKISATFYVKIPIGSSVLNISGTINPTWNTLTGTIIFGKSNLEIEDFSAEISGIMGIMIQPIPFKFPIPIKITTDAGFSTPFPTFNFPLHILKFWDMPNMDISTETTFGGPLGLIKITQPFTIHYNWIPVAFSCLLKDSITVDAGTYDAWRIQSLIGGYFEYHYAPEVGNLIKFDVDMPRGGIEGELKSTNYV